MVELSKRNAAAAGVGDKARFVQGDMYAADFSQATVLALFLLPDNLLKLRDKFAALKPGTRIVANTFGIEEWTADETLTIADDCLSWCTVLLYFVPARVDGTWQTPQGALTLKQQYQTDLRHARDRHYRERPSEGRNVTFTAGGTAYTARLGGIPSPEPPRRRAGTPPGGRPGRRSDGMAVRGIMSGFWPETR